MEKSNENIESLNVMPEQVHDTGANQEMLMDNPVEVAEKVLQKAEGKNLSEETQKKVGFFGKLFNIEEKRQKKNTEALVEIMNHPNLSANYEEAKQLGRGELFVEAYRKLGLPFSWDAKEGRYKGRTFNSDK